MPLNNPSTFSAIAVIAALTTAAPPFLGVAAAQSYYPPPRGAVDALAHPASGETTPRQAVSMRAGPNTGNPVIGTLHPGMPLQILATANYGWMQVQSPVGTGWVYGSYLASGPGMPEPTSVSAPTPMATSGNNQPPSGANPLATINSQPPSEITSP